MAAAGVVVVVWRDFVGGMDGGFAGEAGTAADGSGGIQRATGEGELSALRQQIEPHSLFNTLNTIAGLVREDAGKCEWA